mmetsp:Transcript_26312/g.49358  ORF Transcript_26312/g.49358 Transcript_26312/m.49358 type:complete len:634 (-) Transcript_26312:298-2199(-)
MLDGITTAICRPPRAQYSVSDLGPPRVRYRGVEYKRKDFSVKNSRGLAVKGSVWELINPRLGDSESCILYLHPNSGSRVDVVKTRIMSIAATAKCTVCGFDFAGCGSSEGANVSLGVHEKEDICAVMAYLLGRGCRRFVLWGRSMGAASAAMFFGAYKETLRGSVVALILDSPFTSMQGLASEYTSSSKVPVPGLLLSPALHVLRQSVSSKYGFDILHISPLAAASRITIPTVVLSGSEDKIVPPALSESIYDALNGPKLRIYFKGGHNTHRPSVVFDAIRVVLTGALRGLRAEEYLHLSEAVISNQAGTRTSPMGAGISVPRQGASKGNPHASTTTQGTSGEDKQQDKSAKVKKSAMQQEQQVLSMLQQKGMNSLTDADISQAVGEGKKVVSERTPSGVTGDDSNMHANSTTNALKEEKRSEKQIADVKPTTHEVKDPLCTVQVDICEYINHNGGMSTGSTWSESVGSFLWGTRLDLDESATPPGSFGYLRQQLASDVCPPDPVAWECLLLAQATSVIVDVAIEQTIALVAGFEDARLMSLSEHPDMSEADEALMMSMIVAQVTSELDLVFVRGQAPGSWDSLLLKSLYELQEVSRAGGENIENAGGSVGISNPTGEDLHLSKASASNKPTN